MFAASVNDTPRPRPPAKARRSSAVTQAASTPPPSYAAAFTLTPNGKRFETLLGSPMTATFQKVDRQRPLPTDEDTEWIEERSREELAELLVKADDLIQERENELGMASAVCKNLYDDNVKLKSKHQQLLARLPSAQSPSSSPEPLSRASSRYSVSLSRPISEYDSSPLAPATYRSHARKVSVSTTEISNLADQNAELLEKLERIESESLNADQSGRRALKRLEKEILMLREELEKTQAKSEELEQKTRVGWDSEKIVEEVLKKKDEREAKFRAIRNLGQGGPEDEDVEIRDFAPEGPAFGGISGAHSFYPQGNTPLRPPATPLNRPAYTPAPLTPYPETTLVSQLLEKIQELEVTNNRIIDQQAETTNQLNAMQRETEHISKVYECFADANIVEVAGDIDSDPDNEDRPSHDETIRFTSFRRNLVGDLPDSPNTNERYPSLGLATNSKIRKSVVGLFDGPGSDVKGTSIPDHLQSLNLPVPFTSTSQESHHIPYKSDTGLISPALSSMSLSPSKLNSQGSFKFPARTLETELGNELNGGWGLQSTRTHSHTSSLYDLSPISAPASPSPLSAHASFERSRNLGSPLGPHEALPTPVSTRNIALQLSVEPPTPDRKTEPRPNQGDASGKQSQRYHRMTETFRLRTNRWADGRFKDSPGRNDTSSTTEMRNDTNREAIARPPTPLSLRLASAFDAAVENFTGQATQSTNERDVAAAPENKAPKKPKGFSAIMLELWLWLQFVIIILVFLWAMARRGPKSVLGETGHRRIVSTSSSR